MTLCQAITAVPQLRTSCSVALTDEKPGSGIKSMRLVSKQLRKAMLDEVQGYTFNLTGNGACLLDQMTVLRGTRLSRLRVVVTNKMDGARFAGLNGWDAHSLHLQCFLSGMGNAIRDSTRLEVDVRSIGRKSMEAVTVLLSQLAPACPALQQLRVTGRTGREFLAALGASCKKLSSLEIDQAGTRMDLQQLHLILPVLTHCKVSAPEFTDDTIPPARTGCLSLLSCTSLTSLDIGISAFTLPMWQALPAGLRELCCSVDGYDNPPADMTSLVSLEHLRCYCSPLGNHVVLSNLVAVLRLAPNLQSVMVSGYGTDTEDSSLMSEVYADCKSASIPDLVYLHDRMSLGLVVTSTLCIGGGNFPGLNVSLGMFENDESDDEIEGGEFFRWDLAVYLAALPSFPAFAGLTLDSDFTQPNLPSIANATAALFPNLKALGLEFPRAVNSEDLIHLGPFTALEHLSLSEGDINPASVAVMCTHMPLLETLRLKDCSGFTAQDGVALQNAQRGWGCAINVVVLDTE